MSPEAVFFWRHEKIRDDFEGYGRELPSETIGLRSLFSGWQPDIRRTRFS